MTPLGGVAVGGGARAAGGGGRRGGGLRGRLDAGQQGVGLGGGRGQDDDVDPAVDGHVVGVGVGHERPGAAVAGGRHPVLRDAVGLGQVPQHGGGAHGGQLPVRRPRAAAGDRQRVGVPLDPDLVGQPGEGRRHGVEHAGALRLQHRRLGGEQHRVGDDVHDQTALVDDELRGPGLAGGGQRGRQRVARLGQLVVGTLRLGGGLLRLLLRDRLGGRLLRVGLLGAVDGGLLLDLHRGQRALGLGVDGGAVVEDGDGRAEPLAQALGERGELGDVHLAHRVEDHEQREQQGQHVGVGDEPPFVVLVLLFLVLLGPALPASVAVPGVLAHAASRSCSLGGTREDSFARTVRGLVPAWISAMPSTSSSICAACRSLVRVILAPIGSQKTLADSTPHRVATKALAISGPIDSGSERFSITWISPMTVPMMPMVGAYPPMPLKNFAAALSSAFFALISDSRMARRSSGSVPSMLICRPRLRKGSSIFLTSASSASRPSLRAFSARLTSVWMPSLIGGTAGGSSAILNQAPIFLTSLIEEPATAAPKVPPKTRISGGIRMIAIGLEPSRIIVSRIAPNATPMPIRVAGSMGQRSSRLGKGTTEEPSVVSGTCGRYSPRSMRKATDWMLAR